MTLRKVLSVILMVCTMLVAISPVALAEGASNVKHNHEEQLPDAATLNAAMAHFAADMEQKGGVVFYTKEEAVSYLLAHSKVTEKTFTQEAYVPDGCAAYVVMPASAAVSILPKSQMSTLRSDDLVLLASDWCPKCKTYVIWWGLAILGDIAVRITYAVLGWLFQKICSICSSLIGEEETDIRTECPDCGPDGDITVVDSDDYEVDFYCFRSYTGWSVANPY